MLPVVSALLVMLALLPPQSQSSTPVTPAPDARPANAQPNKAELTNAQPANAQPERWGAIAYSTATGRYGLTYDFPTQAKAINASVVKCGARDCKAVVWFVNSCGAFAKGSGASGWGIGRTRADAEEKALAECRKHGGACRVVAWACTTR